MLAVATVPLFVWPADDEPPESADVVLVLSGGRGHRLAEGLRLVRAGLAPLLAISDGRAPGWEEANALCETAAVRCFRPEPYSTRGEARWLAAEAERRGWERVVVVTSRYHVRRARMIFRRCYDGELALAGAEPPLGNRVVGVAWEWPKSLYYAVFARGC